MKNLNTLFLNPKFLLVIIFLQATTLITVYFNWPNNIESRAEVLSETWVVSEEDYEACLKKSVEERRLCSKLIGDKLAESGLSIKEKVGECIKLRPLFVR